MIYYGIKGTLGEDMGQPGIQAGSMRVYYMPVHTWGLITEWTLPLVFRSIPHETKGTCSIL